MSDPSTAPATLPHWPEPPAAEPSTTLPDPATLPLADTTDHAGDAERMQGLRVYRDPSLAPGASSPEPGEGDSRRRIEWVRPTDLVARMSARASERGVEWNVRAHEWARTQASAAISDARAKAASLGRSMSARLTRTGPDSAEQEVARL